MNGGRADVAQLLREQDPGAVELVVGHDRIAVAKSIDRFVADHAGQQNDHLALHGLRTLDDGDDAVFLGVHPAGDLAGDGRALNRDGFGGGRFAGGLARGFAGRSVSADAEREHHAQHKRKNSKLLQDPFLLVNRTDFCLFFNLPWNYTNFDGLTGYSADKKRLHYSNHLAVKHPTFQQKRRRNDIRRQIA